MPFHNVFPIFPLSISTFNYENHQKFKEKFFSYLDENKEKLVKSTYGFDLLHLHNVPNENFLDFYDDDGDFEKFLINSCKFYINEIIGDKIEDLIVTDCWINICGESASQPFHSHGNSYISGTYYVNYDPENHSHLKFYSPHQGYHSAPFLTTDYEKITQYNARDLDCSFIKEGQLVLWPSNLVHGYEKNNFENRISISMNFMPKRFSSGPYSFTILR